MLEQERTQERTQEKRPKSVYNRKRKKSVISMVCGTFEMVFIPSDVQAPKSRMSTNSITGAYRIFDLIEYSTVFPLEQEEFTRYNGV